MGVNGGHAGTKKRPQSGPAEVASFLGDCENPHPAPQKLPWGWQFLSEKDQGATGLRGSESEMALSEVVSETVSPLRGLPAPSQRPSQSPSESAVFLRAAGLVAPNRVAPRHSYNYHYTQNDHRTELYYFRIIFSNSRSVITELICFWN